MTERQPASVPRRALLAGGLASLALGMVRPQAASARFIMARGMAGGGLAKLAGGGDSPLAHLSLFASVMQLPEGTTLVLGSIRWIEPGSGLRLETTEVNQCRPMAERPDGAEIRGRMRVNGEGNYPFVLQAIDAGPPGSGLDGIRLEVNGPTARGEEEPEAADGEFSYQADATLVAGDFQWLIVDAAVPS